MREMIAPRQAPDTALTVDGNTFTLTGDHTRILTFTRTDLHLDWPLEQTVWRLVAAASDGASWAEPRDAAPLTLTIHEGRLYLKSECGSVSGTFEREGGVLTVEDTKIQGTSCTQSEERARETLVANAPGGTSHSVPYTLTGSTLVVGQIEYLPDGVTTAGYELAFAAEPIAALTFRTR
jgi:hypothetical protein